jgi:hypothetical protein
MKKYVFTESGLVRDWKNLIHPGEHTHLLSERNLINKTVYLADEVEREVAEKDKIIFELVSLIRALKPEMVNVKINFPNNGVEVELDGK